MRTNKRQREKIVQQSIHHINPDETIKLYQKKIATLFVTQVLCKPKTEGGCYRSRPTRIFYIGIESLPQNTFPLKYTNSKYTCMRG